MQLRVAVAARAVPEGGGHKPVGPHGIASRLSHDGHEAASADR